jgi:hypothetical protein
LYIDGFFKTPFSSKITNLNLNGGALGYGSYKLLDTFYNGIKNKPSSSAVYRIAMTDVNWCPYIQLTEGSVYDENETYYIDNGHYSFNEWNKVASEFEELVVNGKLYILEEKDSASYIQLTENSVYNENETYYYYDFNEWTKDASEFKELVTNGKLYVLEEEDSSSHIQLTEDSVYDETETYYYYGLNEWTKDASEFEELVTNGELYIYAIGDNFIPMLMDMADAKNINFADSTSNSTVPSISGIVYINNLEATNDYEESKIRETYQKTYPNLKFFFKNVNPAYSATFLFRNPNTGKDEYVPHKDNTSSTLPSILKISQTAYNENNDIWFSSPFNLYIPERKHHIFLGWSTDPDATKDNGVVIKSTEEWNKLRINSGTWDYTYYAIFEIDSYDVIFLDGDGSVLEGGSLRLPYGTVGITPPDIIPYKNDSDLPLHSTFGFVGYTDNPNSNKPANLNTAMVREDVTYYPIFEEKSVYDNIHPEYFDARNYGGGYQLILNKAVQGKITIPATFTKDKVELPVVSLSNSFGADNNGG